MWIDNTFFLVDLLQILHSFIQAKDKKRKEFHFLMWRVREFSHSLCKDISKILKIIKKNPSSPRYKNRGHCPPSFLKQNPVHTRKYTKKLSFSLKSHLSHIINPHISSIISFKRFLWYSSLSMARYYNHHSYLDYISYFSMPLHLFFFISILFSILCFSWYINYENKLEELINQVKLLLMLSPLVLLLVVHCLSSNFPILMPFPERDSLHRAGGSPWGVALLLVFLLFMISYQSSFHERWFPLYTKWCYMIKRGCRVIARAGLPCSFCCARLAPASVFLFFKC